MAIILLESIVLGQKNCYWDKGHFILIQESNYQEDRKI